ncbi:peptidase M50 [Sulfitobacter litoralis]|uniref:peptidase M50 n=1 Tax=Sulfitobacter litoralis TaxID=335975 RepID=UPI002B2696D6|nr:peptidase M50 [Sulfitobacter litoralis]
MAGSLFSPSWYRVKDLKPRLRRHVNIYRHDYRGRIWFILQDLATGRSHRFSPAAYRMVGLLDGTRSLGEVWDIANEQLGERAPTQDEAIRLLGQLHAADALVADVSPDSRELFRRHKRHKRMEIKQKVWSPLAVRVPIWDPDRFLTATLPFVRPFLTKTFAVIWLLLVLTAAVFAAMNIGALTTNITDRVLNPGNLAVLWLVYPVVKAFHELGHGYAVKKFGGEVHEIGIMFLVLIPVPYVDASAASALREKHKRMLVGGIGIMIELLLASIALFVWLNAESGAVTAVAFNVMLIGGVSTLLFNGNPLLRFDGYYVLADWIEIPNLSGRSTNYLNYLIQRYIYGMREADKVTSLWSERVWFVFYGIAAFIYRMFIMFAIIAYIAGRFFIIGVLLAIWAATTQLLLPIGKGIKFLSGSPKLRTNRPRALITTFAAIALILGALFLVPFPSYSIVDGVIWPSQQAQVRAGTNGFVTKVATTTDQKVRSGDLMMQLDDPFMRARLELIDTQLAGLEIQRSALIRTDRVQSALIAEEIDVVQNDRARLVEELEALDIRAPRVGTAVLPNASDLEGSFVAKGNVIGYVVAQRDTQTVRTVVSQNQIDLVRNDTQSVSVMPVEWGAEPIKAIILREVPGATQQLPTPALGTAGGGNVPVDPSDPNGVQTLGRFFEFEILMVQPSADILLGRRVRVRFDHGTSPLGFQAYRSLRQLFLRLYNV